MMKTPYWRFTLLMPIALCLALFCSCEEDNYDKGDGEYSLLRADFVEAFVGSDKQVEYVVTDDNIRLPLTAPLTTKWVEKADTFYRAVLYYNYINDKAEVLNLSQVSTIPVRKPQEFKDGVKTDPVSMESAWLSGNGKYLNLCVILKTGKVENSKILQTLSIVGDTIESGADGCRTCQLRLAHNQGGVPEYYSQRVYFSVTLSNLPADSLHLSINTYNGVVDKGFKLPNP